MEFTNYKEEDYNAVCEFLIELNNKNNNNINWNWEDLNGCMNILNLIKVPKVQLGFGNVMGKL